MSSNSPAFMLLNHVQGQLSHTLIGGMTWVLAFQFNKAIDQVIDDYAKPWKHFISGFIIVFLLSVFIIAREGKSKKHIDFKATIHEFVLNVNIFKT